MYRLGQYVDKDDETAKTETKGKYKWLYRKDSYLRSSILKAIALYQNGKNQEA